MKANLNKKLPGIYRVPEPLSTMTNRDVIIRKLGCSFFSPQWGKLPKVPIPRIKTIKKLLTLQGKATAYFIL